MHIRRVGLKRIAINNRRLLTRTQTCDYEFMTHSESASLNTVPHGIPVLDAQAAPVEPAQRPELLIVTGMSGAGRSRAAMALEDLDWYVVDNLPPQMLPALAGMMTADGGGVHRLAVVVDVRSRDFFSQFFDYLKRLRDTDVNYRVIFLDASDAALVRHAARTRCRGGGQFWKVLTASARC